MLIILANIWVLLFCDCPSEVPRIIVIIGLVKFTKISTPTEFFFSTTFIQLALGEGRGGGGGGYI